MDNLQTTADWIAQSKRLVIFVGAGLSTESGIPDFRSPGGVWDRYNPQDFNFSNFLASEQSRVMYWRMATEMYEAMRDADPNEGHRAIAELERMGKLNCLITQNIDGLHRKAGNSDAKVLELHGTAMHVTCLDCGRRFDRNEIQQRIANGEAAPRCVSCNGLLKPSTVSFGQSMPERETNEAYSRSASADLFIVVGSSLTVHPAASMPVIAKRNGARLVIINRDATSADSLADLVVRGEAGATMAAILGNLKALGK